MARKDGGQRSFGVSFEGNEGASGQEGEELNDPICKMNSCYEGENGYQSAAWEGQPSASSSSLHDVPMRAENHYSTFFGLRARDHLSFCFSRRGVDFG